MHWVRSKYELKKFKTRWTRSFKRFDFDKYWYYIDEITNDSPVIKGPLSRQNVLCLNKQESWRDDFDILLWHPALSNWDSAINLDRFLNVSESEKMDLYFECERRKQLFEHPKPVMRGYLD
jgi:hypothetical protein